MTKKLTRYYQFSLHYGFTTDTSELAQNLFILNVKVKQEASLPDIDYITPVVHTIPLGEIAFPQGEGFIRIQVKNNGVGYPRRQPYQWRGENHELNRRR